MAGAAFGQRLSAAIAERGPLCLGIDPHPELLARWGLGVDADGLAAFASTCVRAFAGFAIVKPQVAFFEAYGAAGFAVLEQTIAGLSESGVLVLADAKRGDIGSTMAAYAQAWAGDGPLASDAVTASPYLGFGSLTPLLDLAAERGRGVFVLAATSNPEGASVQRQRLPDGRTLAQAMVDEAAAVNRASASGAGASGLGASGLGASGLGASGLGASGSGVLGPRVLGSVGVVVGATLADPPDVSALGGPVLVPGVGAQGGRPEDLAGLGGARPGQLLPAVSREVLRAGPAVADLRAAAERLRDAVAHLA